MDSYDNARTDKGMLERFEPQNEKRRQLLSNLLDDLKDQLFRAKKRRDCGIRANKIQKRIEAIKRELHDLGVSV